MLVLLFVTSSCLKDLDLVPKDTYSDATFWQTEEHFKLATAALYSKLPGHTTADEESDIAYGTTTNVVSTGTNLVPANDENWNEGYGNIRQCNVIIEKGSVADLPAEVSKYIAEARWFRAFFYYNLVKRFGDVVLVKSVLNTDSEELYAARNSRTEVIDFILAELDLTIPILPLESAIAAEDKGRISRGAAQALKARIALFEGTWQKYHGGSDYVKYFEMAVDASESVIDSNEYEIFIYPDSPSNSYRYKFIAAGNDNPGQIVAKRYLENITGHNFTYTSAGQGAGLSATGNFADLFLCTDGLPIEKSSLFQGRDSMISEFMNRDNRMKDILTPPGERRAEDELTDWISKPDDNKVDPIPQKYANFPTQQAGYKTSKFCEENGQFIGWNQGIFYNHIIRYGEVLLIFAEASYEKDGSISDEDLEKSINVLRDYANVGDLTNTHIVANGLNMLSEIRRERTIELAFEGFRLDDLKRWGTAVTEMNKPIKGVKYSGTEYEDYYMNMDLPGPVNIDPNGFVTVETTDLRKFSGKNYLFPIPAEQRAYNPNLGQNPGWDE